MKIVGVIEVRLYSDRIWYSSYHSVVLGIYTVLMPSFWTYMREQTV